MKYLTHPVSLVLLGVLIGAAYGKQLPLVPTVAAKLPGASL